MVELEIAETTCNRWCSTHYKEVGKCNSCNKCQCYDENEIKLEDVNECNLIAGKLQVSGKVDFA